jgi:hypothetical protein
VYRFDSESPASTTTAFESVALECSALLAVAGLRYTFFCIAYAGPLPSSAAEKMHCIPQNTKAADNTVTVLRINFFNESSLQS